MILSDAGIREAREAGELSIEPFKDECLQGASYDLRIGREALMSGEEKVHDLEKEGVLTIKPGEFAILTTLESIRANDRIVGRIGVKSYYTRKGLVFLSGLQIDPGFEGTLVLGVYNAAPKSIVLDYGEPFSSVEFHKLSEPVHRLYQTSDEQREGHLPRVDREYLRDLETKPWTGISEEVRHLTRQVGEMSESVEDLASTVRTMSTVTYAVMLPVLFLILATLIIVPRI